MRSRSAKGWGEIEMLPSSAWRTRSEGEPVSGRRTASRKSKAAVLLLALVMVGSALLVVAPATGAVHLNDQFELGPGLITDEGGLTNILGDGLASDGPDWADLFGADGQVVYAGAIAQFLKDDLAQGSSVDTTTYSGAGGSNKNLDPISAWHWATGNVPAKDDLSNVYAYAILYEGHLIIYVGFERITANGDSHIDLEFFKDNVRLDRTPPCDIAACDWLGVRTPGDLIVSMDFTNGGAFGTMTVREWSGSAYVLVASITGEGCNAASGTLPADVICGFNNGGSINGGPWPNYDSHGHVITMLPTNAFTEFGVDITALEDTTPCLTTVLGKTRSSQSFTAELKDFAGPAGFPLCSANIAIAPDATNEIGAEHTFDVTVNQVFAGVETPAADNTIVTVDLTASYGAAVVPLSDTCASPGTVDGMCSVTFRSDTAGTITGHASADVVVHTQTVHVETDGTGSNSEDATKRYVDAFVTLSPLLATDEVNDPHTLTVHVEADDGTGVDANGDGSFFDPVAGVVPEITFVGTPPSSVDTSDCDAGTDALGDCDVVINSATAGTFTMHAAVDLTVGGVSLHRETTGLGGNSGNAVKVYVDASISISPTAVNVVGYEHTFTVTVEADDGSGSGMQPSEGQHVDFSLTDSNGADSVLDAEASTCDDVGPNTDANGQCTIVFTSATGGLVTGHAWSNVQVGGLSLLRSTDGNGLNSGDATKRFVDALLSLTPGEGANQVGATHTITAYLQIDSGDGDGFQPAADGETITFAIDSGPGVLAPTSCLTGGGTGTCSVSLTSAMTGLTQVSASWSNTLVFPEGSVLVSADAEPVVKRWVDARLTITPPTDANRVGNDHVLTAYLEFDYGLGAGFVAAPAGEEIDWFIQGGPGSLLSSTCLTDATGHCSVTLSSDTTGTTSIGASWTGIIGTAEGDASATATAPLVSKLWVDARLTLSPDEGANQIGNDHVLTALLEFDTGSGFVAAPDGNLITFVIVSGPGSLAPASCTTDGGDGDCSVTLSSSDTGLTTVEASWSGNIVTGSGTVVASATSNDVIKLWIDARISVTPNGDNPIYTTHTFTVLLEIDYGDGDGFVAAPDGSVPTVSVTGGGSIDSETCSAGTVDGECTVTVTSDVVGTTTIDVSWVGDVTTPHGTASAVDAGSDSAVKTWWAGSISITKTVELGPFTTSATVCFTLDRTDGALYTTSDVEQCFAFGPATSHTFSWAGLTAGTYSLTETVTAPYDPIDPITGIVVDGTHRNVVLDPVSNPLKNGSLSIEKLDQYGNLWTSFDVTFEVYPCLDAACTSLGAIVASVNIPSDGNPVVVSLPEGTYLVKEIVPAGYTVQPSDTQVVDIIADQTSSVTFQNFPPSEGCSPGFWKKHPEYWDGVGTDDLTSTIKTYLLFNAYMGVTPAQSGVPDTMTLLDVTAIGGGGLYALDRHAAAALPSADAGINYPFTAAGVRALYRDAVGADPGPETIDSALSLLSDANSLKCPFDATSSGMAVASLPIPATALAPEVILAVEILAVVLVLVGVGLRRRGKRGT